MPGPTAAFTGATTRERAGGPPTRDSPPSAFRRSPSIRPLRPRSTPARSRPTASRASGSSRAPTGARPGRTSTWDCSTRSPGSGRSTSGAWPSIRRTRARFSRARDSPRSSRAWTAGRPGGTRRFGGFNVGLETSAFLFDPANSTNVLAASTLGLLRSTDGGETWGGYGNVNDSFFTLAADPASATTLYAGNISRVRHLQEHRRRRALGHHQQGPPGEPGSDGRPAARARLRVGPGAFDDSLRRHLRQRPLSQHRRRLELVLRRLRDAKRVRHRLRLRACRLSSRRRSARGVYQSADGGGTWTPSNAGLDVGIVNSLLSDPASPATVYAALFDGVYRSSDGGGTWQTLNNGLPIAPVSALASRPGSPPTLLAATLGGGIFKSTDGGGTWSASSQGLTDSVHFLDRRGSDQLPDALRRDRPLDHGLAAGLQERRRRRHVDADEPRRRPEPDHLPRRQSRQRVAGDRDQRKRPRLLPEPGRGEDVEDRHDGCELRRSQHDLLQRRRARSSPSGAPRACAARATAERHGP